MRRVIRRLARLAHFECGAGLANDFFATWCRSARVAARFKIALLRLSGQHRTVTLFFITTSSLG